MDLLVSTRVRSVWRVVPRRSTRGRPARSIRNCPDKTSAVARGSILVQVELSAITLGPGSRDRRARQDSLSCALCCAAL